MSLDLVLGQPRARRALEKLLETRQIPSALLFLGPAGVGKGLAAVEFAKALVSRCEKPCAGCADCTAIAAHAHPDVRILDAQFQASFEEEELEKQRSLKIDTVRALRGEMEMKSMLGGWKVAIIPEAERLTPESAHALLKIVEEPPPATLWILCCSARGRLPRTIISRCFTVNFSPLPDDVVAKILGAREIPRARALTAAALCDGSASRAFEFLDEKAAPYLDGSADATFAADSLPKEGSAAREAAGKAVDAVTQNLRLHHLRGQISFAQAEPRLRRLAAIRAALRSNSDPKLALTLAILEGDLR